MADNRALVQVSTGTQGQIDADTLIVGTGVTTGAGDITITCAGTQVNIPAGKNLVGTATSNLTGFLNASFGGTLGITGVSTFTGQINVNGGIQRSTPGTMTAGSDANTTAFDLGRVGILTTIKGNLQVDGTETVVGTTTFQSDALLNGNTTIGDATTDQLTVTARLVSNFLALADNVRDIGSSSLRFANVNAATIVARGDATDTSKATLLANSLTSTVAFTLTAGANALSLNGSATNLQAGGATKAIVGASNITVQSGVTLDTTGTGLINLPALFLIAGVAVSANVTATNLGTLTGGGDASALHTHTGLSAAGSVLTGTSGEAINVGELVCYDNDTGTPRVFKADANGTGVRRNAMGVAGNTVASSGLSITIYQVGERSIPDTEWDSVPAVGDVGKWVYMSNTAGNWVMEGSQPTTAATQLIMGEITQGGTGAVKVAVSKGHPVRTV